jgi:tetratricopeptide (TPR) repeat protein
MYDNITVFYDDAEMIITEFNARKAIKLLEKRIAEGQETAQNYAFLAKAYSLIPEWEEALRCALKARALEPNYYFVDAILVNIYSEDYRFARAEKYLMELFEKAPEDYATTFITAMHFYNKIGREEEAKFYANKVVELNKTNLDLLILKNLAYNYLGDAKKSDEAFYVYMLRDNKSLGKALRYLLLLFIPMAFLSMNSLFFCFVAIVVGVFLFIHRTKVMLQISDFYYKKAIASNDSEKALKYVNRALKIRYRHKYFIRKALILWQLERFEEAIEIFKNVIEKEDSYVECYGYLSKIYQQLGDYKLALEYANLEILNDSLNEEGYYDKFMSLRKIGKITEAIKVLEKLEQVCPKSEDIYAVFFGVYFDAGEYEMALFYINKQLIRKKTGLYYREKMMCLFQLRRYDEALSCGEISIEYEENVETYYWIASCHLYLGAFENALENINKAILVGGYNDKWVLLQKSNILNSLGKSEEAEIAYKKAIELGYEA